MDKLDQKYKELYAEIPKMKCNNCHECCGLVPFSDWELSQIDKPKPYTDINCPYLSILGCTIYENRPFMCRLFGTVEDLQCPYGCKPDKMLSAEKGLELTFKYQELMGED